MQMYANRGFVKKKHCQLFDIGSQIQAETRDDYNLLGIILNFCKSFFLILTVSEQIEDEELNV